MAKRDDIFSIFKGSSSNKGSNYLLVQKFVLENTPFGLQPKYKIEIFHTRIALSEK